MKFDLNAYRNENSDLFPNQSLDDVARHIYNNVSPHGAPEGKSYAQTGKFSGYNDFLAKSGLDSQIATEVNQRNAPDRPGTWGVVRDVADQAVKSTGNIGGNLFNVAAGAVDSVGSTIGGFGRVLRDSSAAKTSPILRSVGEFASRAPDAFRGVSDVLNGVSSDARANGESILPRSRQMLRDDNYRGTILSALGSASESAVPMLAGGAVAKAWGARAAATKVFAAGTGAVSFGLSTFADAKREALQNGLSETDATIHATVQGVCETGSEFVGDLAYQFIGPAGGAVTQIGRKALQNGLSGLFRTNIAALGRESLKSMAVEGGSELVNAYAQAEFANAAGMGQVGVDGKEMSGMDAVRAQAGEIGVATLALALFGIHAGYKQRHEIKNYLTNPSIHPENKMELARELGAEMNKLDSFGSSKPGTVGTEFVFSVERQLQETGNVSLTNNLEAAAQLEHEANNPNQEWDDPNNFAQYDVSDDASRILSEPSPTGSAPLGMSTDNSLPSDITDPQVRAQHPLSPGSTVDDGDPGPTHPDDLYNKHVNGGDIAAVESIRRQDERRYEDPNSVKPSSPGTGYDTEAMLEDVLHSRSDGGRSSYDEAMSSALKSHNPNDAKWAVESATDYYKQARAGLVKASDPDSGDAESARHFAAHLDAATKLLEAAKARYESFAGFDTPDDVKRSFESALDEYKQAHKAFSAAHEESVQKSDSGKADPDAMRPHSDRLKNAIALLDSARARSESSFGFDSTDVHSASWMQSATEDGFKPTIERPAPADSASPPSSPPVQRDSATYSVGSGISATAYPKPSPSGRTVNNDPALSAPTSTPSDRRRGHLDIDTHPGVNDKIASFVNSREDQSVDAVRKASKSKNRVDASWAAVTAMHHSKLAWARYAALKDNTDRESINARGAAQATAKAYAAIHEHAMGRFERSGGEDFSNFKPTPLTKLPDGKRHPSKGDDKGVLRNGVIASVVRFMNSHNLSMRVSEEGVPHLVRRTGNRRETDRNTVGYAYDAGYIYDKGDLNPHSNYSTGVVGGLPIKNDLYWRNSDSLANVASNVDFSETRVGAHRAYRESLSTGNPADVDAANKVLERFYDNDKAVKGDSRPNEIITTEVPAALADEGVKADVEHVWDDSRVISVASADEIHSRASEAVANGTFKGRIREFTDSKGDRILRIIHDRSSSSKFEDYKVDTDNPGSPEAARNNADKVKVNSNLLSRLPRKAGTRAAATAVVNKMLDDLHGELSDGNPKSRRVSHDAAMRSAFGELPSKKAQRQIDLINSRREELIARIQRKMDKENFSKSSEDFLRENDVDTLVGPSLDSSHLDPGDYKTSGIADGEDFTASRLDETEHTETSAAAAMRGSKTDDRSEIAHRAREIYNMTPSQQAEWLREFVGDKKLGSTPATHELFIEAVEDGIGRMVERRAQYNKYIRRSDISDNDRFDARIERNALTKKISEAYTLIESYNNLIDEQATRQNETDPDEADGEGGVGHNLESGSLNRVRPGHITISDAYSLIKSEVARPEFKNGRLVAVSYWDAKAKTTHYVPIDLSVNEQVLQARPNGAANPGSLGNYDRAAADDLAVRLFSALNIDRAHAQRIHFVTAQELFDQTGFRDGLDGAAGIFNPADGNSYIITDQIHSVEEFGRIVLHEVGAHAGLFELIPSRAGRAKLLEQLASNQTVVDWFIAGGHPSSKHMANYAELSPSLRLAVGNEMFAAIFQTMKLNKNGDFVIGKGQHKVGGIVDAAIGFVQSGVQKIARALGVNMRMTNAQVRNLIAHVVARNGAAGVRAAAQAFQTTYNGYNNLATWQLSAAQKLRRDHQDYAISIKLMQDSITNMGRIIPANQDAHAAVTDAVNTTAVYLSRFDKLYFKPLVKAMADNKVDYKRFDEFLIARHALERNAFHASKIANASGWKDSEANAVLSRLQADGLLTVTAGPNGNIYGGLYGDIGKKVEDISKLRLDILFHGHMITKTEYDNVTRAYKYYVPMSETENLPGVVPGIGGIDTVGGGKDVKFASGRDQHSALGLVQTVHQVETAIRRVEQNKVYQHIDRLIAANPNSAAFTRLPAGTRVNPATVTADGIISVKYNGVERLILVQNKDLARALKGGTPQECGAMLNVMRKFNSFLVKMNVVYSPVFIPVNQWRDGMTAFAHLASRSDIGGVDGMRVFKLMGSTYPSATRFAFSRHVGSGSYDKRVDVGGQQVMLSTLYRDYENSGAKPGFVFCGSVEQKSKSFVEEFERASGQGAVASASRFAHAAGEFASAMSEASESSARFAAYVAMRQAGIDPVIAGRECKELTVNFSRRGEKTSVLNAIYLFANAGIQDAAMITKLMVGRGNINKRGLAVAAGIASFNALLTAMCRASGDDEYGVPLYDKLNDSEKANNITLPAIKGVFPKIPQAYGFGLFASIGRVVSDLVTKESMGGGKYSVGTASADLLAAVLHSFNPIGGEFDMSLVGFGDAIMPQIAKIPYELAANSNHFGAPIRPDNGKAFDENGRPNPKYQIPNHLNHKNNTSPLAKATADGLAKLGFDTSPDNLDHTAESVFGATGKFVMQTIAMMTTGTATPINSVPIVRRFLGTPPDYIDNKNFKSNVSDIKATKKEYDRIRLDPAYAGDVRKFVEDNRSDLRAANALPGYEDRLHALYVERKKATTHDAVAKINSSIRRLHQEFNAHYYALQAK